MDGRIHNNNIETAIRTLEDYNCPVYNYAVRIDSPDAIWATCLACLILIFVCLSIFGLACFLRQRGADKAQRMTNRVDGYAKPRPLSLRMQLPESFMSNDGSLKEMPVQPEILLNGKVMSNKMDILETIQETS